MKKEVIRYYRQSADAYKRYLIDNKKRIGNFKKIYSSHKKFFGKNVLDIGCGGGVLGFVIEHHGHSYVGIDINPDMITNAKRHAKKIKSKNRFVLGDIRKKKISKKFNTITFLGNAICHLNTFDFLDIVRTVNKMSDKGSYFIIDHRDVVKLLFDRKWKYRMTEKGEGKRPLISVTTGANTQRGEIHKKFYSKSGKFKVGFNHTIWSPFILEPIMISNGWKLVRRKQLKEWQGWIEVYRKL